MYMPEGASVDEKVQHWDDWEARFWGLVVLSRQPLAQVQVQLAVVDDSLV
jgi:hypothetical protein